MYKTKRESDCEQCYNADAVKDVIEAYSTALRERDERIAALEKENKQILEDANENIDRLEEETLTLAICKDKLEKENAALTAEVAQARQDMAKRACEIIETGLTFEIDDEEEKNLFVEMKRMIFDDIKHAAQSGKE